MASVSEILTQGEWTSVTNLEDLDLDGTFVEFGDDCEKDDHFVFKPDFTFQQKTGATDCDGGVGVNTIAAEGDWSLEDTDQTLVLHFFPCHTTNQQHHSPTTYHAHPAQS